MKYSTKFSVENMEILYTLKDIKGGIMIKDTHIVLLEDVVCRD